MPGTQQKFAVRSHDVAGNELAQDEAPPGAQKKQGREWTPGLTAATSPVLATRMRTRSKVASHCITATRVLLTFSQENTNSGRGSLLFTCRMRYYKLLAGLALPDLARAHAAEHGVRAGGCGRIRLPRAAGGA